MLASFVAVESLLDPVRATKVWPESIVSNEIFLEQVKQRKELNERLENVIKRLPRPDISLEVAINQKHITEEQAAELYTSLSVFLESNQDYRRLILYLPFEFLPQKTWKPANEKLQRALDRFRRAYMEAWECLLSIHDVRANFVDGDVPEVEQRVGDLPRVVKAAHLIPKLVENGLIEVRDVVTLMEASDDPTLRDSIADTLPVLVDMGFLTEKEIKHRRERIKSEPRMITEKRKAWLELREKQKTIEALARNISRDILENKLTQEALLKLWSNNDPDTKESVFRALNRLHHLGVVAKEQLAELDIVTPQLAGPFSENLGLMKDEMADIRNMVASVASNPELANLIYPVVLVFGSRLNGYGEQSADIDLAVFVRPGTSFDKRARLKELLKATFAHEKIRGDEIVEFWLEEKKGQLKIRDFTEPDVSLGESYWTHVLFGAAWEGDEVTIRELYAKLLAPYLSATGEARRLYLEDLEQSTLQYRLMHKGYERFFPPCGGIHTEHADEIDGKSMFWDSGYRQLATRLFISRVFLPKIPASYNKGTASES